jgi:hypothetical protein
VTKFLLILIVVAAAAFVFARFLGAGGDRAPVEAWRPRPVEAQLADLAACGISLRADRTMDELLMSFSRESYETSPTSLIVMLGSEVEAEPWGRPFSDDVWHFDTECVEDHGAYADIARRLRTLAGDALPLENIEDYVDLEEGVAWLELTLDGKTYHWDAKVDDDWVDPAILSKLAELLVDRNQGVRFTYLDLGGQDCILGAATPEQLDCLRSKCGLGFVWLE